MNRLVTLCLFILNFGLYEKSYSNPVDATSSPDRILTDTIDPVIFCPNSQIVNLAPLDCDTILTYSVQTYDDQGQVILILLDGIASGGAFPTGTTVNYYLATDLAGNTAECSFSINCLEPMTQPNCRETTHVLLNQDCEASLSPFNILFGGPYGCPLHYFIEVDKTAPFGNGPWIDADFDSDDIGQTYQVRVTSLLNNSRCFGFVNVFDSIAPTVLVQPITVPCAVPVEQLTPQFLRDSFDISIAFPGVIDACSDSIDLTFVDVQQNLPCDDTTVISGIIRRIWSATDDYNNTKTVEQIIYRRRLLSEVTFPSDKYTVCDNPDFSETTNGKPYVQFGGRKYVLGPNSYCEFDIQYADTIQPSGCGGNYDVARTWKIYDACLPLSANNPRTGIQLIHVEDNHGPLITCPGRTIIDVTSVACEADINLPDVPMRDGCSDIANIQAFWMENGTAQDFQGTVEITGGDTLGVFGTVTGFTVGTYTLLYVAEDACGNTGDCSFQLAIGNQNPPVAKCDSFLLIGLPTNGYLNLPAQVLDNGSTDDCSTPVFKAKLNAAAGCDPATMFSDTLHLCCHDSGDTLHGVLRIYDIGTPSGQVSPDYGTGHYSDCAFRIKVSGVNPPGCTAPANITVNCEDFDPTLDSYGGLASQTCSVDSVQLIEDISGLDTVCPQGFVNRIFKVFSANGQMAQCTQRVTVTYHQHYYIKFPDDVIATNCDGSGDYGIPVFFGQDCERLVATYTDEIFTVVPDACSKIERTWIIFNDCTYDSSGTVITIPNPNPKPLNNDPENLVGPVLSSVQTVGDPWKSTIVKINPTDAQATNYSIFYDANANAYRYKQIIKILDTTKPVLEDCTSALQEVDDQSTNDPQLWHASYWFDPLHVSTDLCEGIANINVTASDACSGGEVNISYQLFLDLNNDGSPETVVNSANLPPSNTVFYNNLVGSGEARQFDFRPVSADQKWRFGSAQTVANGKKTVALGFTTTAQPNTLFPLQLPYGTHKIKWTVQDLCGNQTVCEHQVKVRDTKPPVVFCVQPITVNILPTKMIQIWATDLLQFSDDNCTPAQYLFYGIRKAGTGSGFPYLNQNNDPVESIVYDCDELGANTVELWAKDRSGNAASCQTTIQVNDPSHNCDDTPLVLSGSVKTENNLGIADVEISLYGSHPFQPPFSFNPLGVTDTSGYYSYNNGGIPTASDITIKPELDTNPLNGLTTFDLVLMSKHILGIQGLGSPYKIIAADANRSNSVTTSDIVELRKLILGINQYLPNNNSWRFVPTGFVFQNLDNPFSHPIPDTIRIPNILDNTPNVNFVGMKIGDVNNSVTPHATGGPDDRSAGTLFLEAMPIGSEDLAAGQTTELEFRTAADWLGCQFTLEYEGLVLLDIIPGSGMDLGNFARFADKSALTMSWEKGGKADFRLRFRSTKKGKLREMMHLDHRITRSEAYRDDLSQAALRYDLALQFPGAPAFELYQNQPNPFSGNTFISFNLPEESDATLRIFDAAGRLLYSETDHYAKGMHRLEIAKSALDATGVLYYQLDTPQQSAMRKMVRL